VIFATNLVYMKIVGNGREQLICGLPSPENIMLLLAPILSITPGVRGALHHLTQFMQLWQ
jgi:hypothetical protein